MDFVKNAMSGGNDNNKGENNQQNENAQGGGGGGGGFLGGLGDKLNSAAGGGRESEKNEDLLDKGMFCTLSSLSNFIAQHFASFSFLLPCLTPHSTLSAMSSPSIYAYLKIYTSISVRSDDLANSFPG